MPRPSSPSTGGRRWFCTGLSVKCPKSRRNLPVCPTLSVKWPGLRTSGTEPDVVREMGCFTDKPAVWVSLVRETARITDK